MKRQTRHQINLFICALVLAHAAYWFLSGSHETATNLAVTLRVAQVVVGLVGIVWFWRRAQQAQGPTG
ncbi:MAG TPA: hypothetical protein VIN61_13470 [Gammaproteobacteria bacterium]